MHKYISKFRDFLGIPRMLYNIYLNVDALQMAIGRIESRQLQSVYSDNLQDYEFSVYAQSGEDGIIQHLLQKIKPIRPIFVEFGVQNYTESNTRFLLQDRNWSGLVIDASPTYIEYIKADPIYWRYNLKAECSFIDAENINTILKRNGIGGDIGLLSVDIDGNDYWVWKAVDCISPAIVICEYNSLFGSQHKVTIPYDSSFYRTTAHFSNLYFGASLAAITQLGCEKGYQLVGSNATGNNAFFVRNDLVGNLPMYTPEQVYVKAQFRESRDVQGRPSFLGFEEAFAMISEMPLYDIDLASNIKVRDIIAGQSKKIAKTPIT